MNEGTENLLNSICQKYKTEILKNENLSKHTTFGLGGPCSYFVKINSVDVLSEIIGLLNKKSEKYFILGRGSNIIAKDEGYDGCILNISNSFSNIKKLENDLLEVLSGTTLSQIGAFAKENSLSGMERLCGIPGSLGGAVYMNAGAYGAEIKDILMEVQAIDKNGNIKTYKPEDLDLSYRHSIFEDNGEIVVSAVLKLEQGKKEDIAALTNEYLKKRKDKQPLEYKSAGSTFKRPQGSYASLLIDLCGLKGLSVGDAQVSTKHSGFVINKGNATASDVLELCKKIKTVVKEKTGYELELEPVVL